MDLVDRLPLYLRVKHTIMEQIRSGSLMENGRLPSEEELAQKFKVSRATIRSALQSLEDDGVIIKRHGVGTFVNEEGLQVKMRIDDAKGFLNLIKQSGRRPSSEKPFTFDTMIDAPSAKLLGVSLKEKCFSYEQLFLGDDEPAIHVTEIIPHTSLAKNPDPEKMPLSIFEFADQYFHSPIHYFITEIIPVESNKTIEDKMQLNQREIMLKLEELHFSNDNQPVALSYIFVRDKMIRFQILRNRPL